MSFSVTSYMFPISGELSRRYELKPHKLVAKDKNKNIKCFLLPLSLEAKNLKRKRLQLTPNFSDSLSLGVITLDDFQNYNDYKTHDFTTLHFKLIYIYVRLIYFTMTKPRGSHIYLKIKVFFF